MLHGVVVRFVDAAVRFGKHLKARIAGEQLQRSVAGFSVLNDIFHVRIRLRAHAFHALVQIFLPVVVDNVQRNRYYGNKRPVIHQYISFHIVILLNNLYFMLPLPLMT